MNKEILALKKISRKDYIEKPKQMNNLFPMTYMQERMWNLEGKNNKDLLFNYIFAYRILGELNPLILKKALLNVVKKHAILRTKFINKDGRPLQKVLEVGEIEIEHKELTEDFNIHLYCNEIRKIPFDFSHDLPIKLYLLRDSLESHILVISMHHLVFDGWSLGVLMKEIIDNYNGLLKDPDFITPPLPFQYHDYAASQRKELSGLYNSQKKYWESVLKKEYIPLQLPYKEQSKATNEGSLLKIELDGELSSRVRQICKEKKLSIFIFFLTCFKVLMAPFSKTGEVAISTPIANRTEKNLEIIIGYFANKLIIRSNLEEELNISYLLDQVRLNCLKAFSNQDIPFELAAESIMDSHAANFFQLALIVEQDSMDAGDKAHSAITFQNIRIGSGIAKFDLALIIDPRQENIKLSFQYKKDSFKNETINILLEELKNIIESFIAHVK